MTKAVPRKFETLKKQRDDLVAAYNAKHGSGAAKKIFAQELGDKKTVLKFQIDLLSGLVDAADIGKATTISTHSTAKAGTSNPSPANTITRSRFDALSPRQKTDFCLAGGKITTD
jgi:hypothetical protein